MSQLEELLQRSQAPGVFVSRKRFTLSRDKAVEKQREYALRDPHQYILELVQAAVLAGASYIAIDVKPETILVAFIGASMIQESELLSIMDYLFADRGDPKLRHLVQLAIGLNALLQQEPLRIRMESGDGEQAIRLDLDPKGKGQLGVPAQALSGTYLLMERRAGLFKRLRAKKLTPEQRLVESRCGHSPVPIIINGKAPFGYTSTREVKLFGVKGQRSFDRGEMRGTLALTDRAGRRSLFDVVIGGCVVTTLELPEVGSVPSKGRFEKVFYGVVCDDRLRKTADQGDVVRGPRFSRMLRVLQDEARLLCQGLLGRDPVQTRIPESLESADGDAQILVPLPDQLSALGPHGTLALALFEEHPRDPVFWVEPVDQGRLAHLADPARFPFRVLVLQEDMARSLVARIPGLPLQRLSTAADVEYVERVLSREHPVIQASVGQTLGGELLLRAHGLGHLPAWGTPGQLQVCVSSGDRALWLGSFALPYMGVSAELRLPEGSTLPQTELSWMSTLTRGILAELWRLVLQCPQEQPWARLLLAQVLGSQARVRLSREAEPFKVHAALPPEWGELGQALAERPLTKKRLSLRGLESIWNTESMVQVDSETGAALEPLLDRLGHGRVFGPSAKVLAAVGYSMGSWWPVRGEVDWDALICLCEDMAPLELDQQVAVSEGWRARPGPDPRIHLCEVGDPQRSWDAGLALLLEHWPSAGPRLVRWRIQDRLAKSVADRDVDPVLLATDSSQEMRLSEWCARPDFAVVAVGGLRLREAQVVALQPDELRFLEGLRGHALRLRFDDAPHLWRKPLAHPDEDTWLLRVSLSIPGVRGWLGLRLPFDATGGVLVRDLDGGWLALSQLDARLPCHGLVWITDSRPTLSEAQQELLSLGALQLYQRLAQGMRARGFGAHQEHARRYAMLFCWLCVQQGRGHLGTVRLLAAAVVICDSRGERWGTLDTWLDAPPGQRPELPIELPAQRHSVQTVRRDLDFDRALSSTLTQLDMGLRVRLHRAPGARGAAQIVRSTDLSQVHLQLNTRHALVREGERSEGPARELLLMECARLIAKWAQEQGGRVDLAALQQVLLARRLDL